MRWSLFGSRAARRARARGEELTSFRLALDAACNGVPSEFHTDVIRGFQARADALILTEEDSALELEMLDGLRELAELVGAVERDGLPLLETQHRVLTGEPCRFSAPATRVEGADGASGRLFFTDRRVVFLAGSVTGVSWSSIVRLVRDGRDLALTAPPRQLLFRLNTFADAFKAAWLADRLSRNLRKTP